MAGQKEKMGCLEDEVIYPHGWEYCKDIYCFNCVDGRWETHPWIGVSIDPSRVL